MTATTSRHDAVAAAPQAAWRPSLQLRLYALVLLAILPALAVYGLSTYQTYRTREAQIRAEVLRLTEFAAGELDRLIAAERSLLVAASQSPSVLARDRPVCDAYLASLMRHFPQSVGFGTLDREGRLICTSRVVAEDARGHADRSYFQEARRTGAFSVGTLTRSRRGDRPFIGFGLPVYTVDGRFDGVAFSAMDLEWLSLHFSARPLPIGGTLSIIDREGTVLVRVPNIDGAVGTNVSDDIEPLMLSDRPGSGESIGLDGEPVIYGYIPPSVSPARGLYVEVSAGKRALMGDIRERTIRNLALLLASFAFALTAAALAGRYFIRRPLARLERAADLLRRGDLTARAGLGGFSPDMARLGQVFDEMARALQRGTAEIAGERERLQLIADSVPALVSFVDRSQHYRFLNKAYELWFGHPRAEIVGRHMRDVLGQAAYEIVRPRVEAALAGERQSFESLLPYKLGGGREVSVQYIPSVGPDGASEGFYVFVEDISEARRAQRLHLAQKEALELAMTGADLDRVLEALARAAADPFGGRAAILLVADQPPLLRVAAAHGLDESYLREMERLPAAPESSPCGVSAFTGKRMLALDVQQAPDWAAPYLALAREHGIRTCWSTPIRFFGGPVLGTLAVYPDEQREPLPVQIDVMDAIVRTAAVLIERKRAEEHQRLLLMELNHRVKNTLAVVQAIAGQSLRSAGRSPEESLALFEARLRTLAAANDLLTGQDWRGAGLRALVDRAVSAHGDGGRYDIEGPPVRLGPRPAVSLALALHELATNAAKYGALSVPEGRVEVRWEVTEVDGERRLRLRWQERGGPPVEPPARRGFGTRMLERALARELRAQLSLRYEPTGVVFELDAPMTGGGIGDA